MKVLFVYYDAMEGAGGKYYEGIASISAVLKQNGHLTKLFHITEPLTPAQFTDIYEAEYADFDITALSSTTNSFNHISGYAKSIKNKFNDVITVCGGIHPTLCSEEVIQEGGIDIVCIGEGEYPMLDLCTRLENENDITSIQNFWVKKDGQVFRNPVRPLIEDLDSLPMPDRDLFDFENSMDKAMGRISFMGSRGCPFNCTYCCNHALKKIICHKSSAYVRFKSVNRLMSEIKFCLNKYGTPKKIHFLDDILTLKPSWFNEFSSKYKQEISLPYVCNSRFDILNEEKIKSLKASGCIQLGLGLESGDEFIRVEVMNRKQEQSDIINTGRACHENNIDIHIFTIIGVPFENLRRALNTVKTAVALRPESVQTSIFYPYENTKLYDICKENGFLTEKKLDSYFQAETVLNLPNFPEYEIVFAYKNFNNFVKGYLFAQKLCVPFNYVLTKVLDLLWLHPRIFGLVEPIYQVFKRIYKKMMK